MTSATRICNKKIDFVFSTSKTIFKNFWTPKYQTSVMVRIGVGGPILIIIILQKRIPWVESRWAIDGRWANTICFPWRRKGGRSDGRWANTVGFPLVSYAHSKLMSKTNVALKSYPNTIRISSRFTAKSRLQISGSITGETARTHSAKRCEHMCFAIPLPNWSVHFFSSQKNKGNQPCSPTFRQSPTFAQGTVLAAPSKPGEQLL